MVSGTNIFPFSTNKFLILQPKKLLYYKQDVVIYKQEYCSPILAQRQQNFDKHDAGSGVNSMKSQHASLHLNTLLQGPLNHKRPLNNN